MEYWSLADEVASDLVPLFHEDSSRLLDLSGMYAVIDRFRRYFPNFELMFLDASGNRVPLDSRGDFDHPQSYPVTDLEAALHDKSFQPRLHTLTNGNAKRVPFSVARLTIHGVPGYLLILLHRNDLDPTDALLLEDVGTRAAILAVAAVIVLSWAIGLVTFRSLTRNFENLVQVVRAFRDGNYAHRATVSSSNEIGELAHTVNEMADRIVSNLHELNKRDENRRELMSNIAHDLRAPAGGILALTGTLTLQREHLSNEAQERCCQELAICGESLVDMVDELFELAKLESGTVVAEVEEVAVSSLIKGAAARFRARAERKKILFHSPANLPPLVVMCDERLIGRVLDNLLSNSLKFTSPGGSVSLSVAELPGVVQFSVSDSGAGMSEAEVQQIFERYRQLKNARDIADSGMGIGLAIVAQALFLHHRTMTVQSKLGVGSTFFFELPLAAIGV